MRDEKEERKKQARSNKQTQVCGCREARKVWHSKTVLFPIPPLLLDWEAQELKEERGLKII